MERIERIAKLHRLLSVARRGLSADKLKDDLQCSRATLYRDVAFLRDALGAPIEHDAAQHLFHYNRDEAPFELPGLWLSADEIYALMLAKQVLQRTGAGLLGDALGRFQPRIEALLGDKANELSRVRVLRQAARKLDENLFRLVANALLERRVIHFVYKARSTEQSLKRMAHPQRLTHYRDNWYLDAWDDQRGALRSFALDRIRDASMSEEIARNVADEELDAHLSGGYGIFSGTAKDVATILFSQHAARWVAEERWHSQQQGKFLADGSFELKVPYSNARELLMDVLRYGPDAQVIAPIALREQMSAMLSLASGQYR
jgi:predicted DNA-binding transcriptional regulator YafY